MKIQFKILTLLFLLLSVAVACAVHSHNESRRKIEERLASKGCTPHLKYVLPSELRHLFGVRFVSTISEVTVHYQAPNFENERIEILKSLPDLEEVRVYDYIPGVPYVHMFKRELPHVSVTNLVWTDRKSFEVEYSEAYSWKHFVMIASLVMVVALIGNWVSGLWFRLTTPKQTHESAD